MNIGTDVWGRCLWTSMHLIALGYPENPTESERQAYKRHFLSIGEVLPCIKCKENFAKHINDIPIDMFLYNKDQLFRWTVELHNIVNKANGKLQWDVVDAYNYYTTGDFLKQQKASHGTKGICTYSNVILLFLNFMVISMLLIYGVWKQK